LVRINIRTLSANGANPGGRDCFRLFKKIPVGGVEEKKSMEGPRIRPEDQIRGQFTVESISMKGQRRGRGIFPGPAMSEKGGGDGDQRRSGEAQGGGGRD